jgi:hypothetical protein
VGITAIPLVPTEGAEDIKRAKMQCVDDIGITPADVILVEMIKQGRKSF